MPSLWLALVLFQLATAVPTPPDSGAGLSIRDLASQPASPDVHRRAEGDEEFKWRGTSINAPNVGYPGADQRIPINYEAALKDASAQPELPVGKTCFYTYGHSAADIDVFGATSQTVTDRDVAQGAIGDCGFGASVAAVAATGHAKYLHDRVAIKNGTYEFTLTQKGKDTKVVVDDQLPKRSGASDPRCLPYLSFQPAGENARTGYVPLAEKAVAKYLNAYPTYKSTQEKGYLGLEGIWPDIALELLTGAKGKRTFRQTVGLDQGLVTALDRCLTQNEPCVLGSPPATDTAWQLFAPTKPAKPVFNLPYGEKYVSGVLTVNITRGAHDVVDHDNGPADTRNTVVPSHAWALDKNKSVYDPKNLRASKIRILNPWGENLKPWNALDAPNALELSFPALASIITGVFTVESLP